MKNEENRRYSIAIKGAKKMNLDSMKNGSPTYTLTTIGITDAATPPSAPKKNRKSGSIEFEEIFVVAKTKTSHEKLGLIFNVASKMECLLHLDVTERMQLFDVKFIKPIITCFLTYCDGKSNTFHGLHLQFLHPKFFKGCRHSKDWL